MLSFIMAFRYRKLPTLKINELCATRSSASRQASSRSQRAGYRTTGIAQRPLSQPIHFMKRIRLVRMVIVLLPATGKLNIVILFYNNRYQCRYAQWVQRLKNNSIIKIITHLLHARVKLNYSFIFFLTNILQNDTHIIYKWL